MKKVFLCILDGFSVANKEHPYNAIFKANTPTIQRFMQQYPMSMLKTSGLSVGLPEGQMGNSEVGHMTIGSGRVIYQDLPKIDKAIEDGTLFAMPAVQQTLIKLKASGNALHLAGLCSGGGVHSHLNHIIAIANFFTDGGVKVHLHLISDGRDVSPQSFAPCLEVDFLPKIKHLDSLAFVSTICGRYYAMDRDGKMERTMSYYNLISGAQCSEPEFTNPLEAVKKSYENAVSDEFILPCKSTSYAGFKNGDAVFMANFRADRARQIFDLLTQDVNLSHKIAMTHYSDAIAVKSSVLFKKEAVEDCLAEVLAKNKLKQLHIAETEKYAHVTFFFNGGKEACFEGEERILIKSPSVATYDLQPEMSLPEVELELCKALNSAKYDFIVCNIANGDMVGHSGNFEAAKKAAEHIDKFLSQMEQVVLQNNYAMLITADHGNLEEMVDLASGEVHTQHTTNDVQLIYIAGDSLDIKLKDGSLADIAPTVLALMDINQPRVMSGKNLIKM